jgi:hypothetical protein
LIKNLKNKIRYPSSVIGSIKSEIQREGLKEEFVLGEGLNKGKEGIQGLSHTLSIELLKWFYKPQQKQSPN